MGSEGEVRGREVKGSQPLTLTDARRLPSGHVCLSEQGVFVCLQARESLGAPLPAACCLLLDGRGERKKKVQFFSQETERKDVKVRQKRVNQRGHPSALVHIGHD